MYIFSFTCIIFHNEKHNKVSFYESDGSGRQNSFGQAMGRWVDDMLRTTPTQRTASGPRHADVSTQKQKVKVTVTSKNGQAQTLTGTKSEIMRNYGNGSARRSRSRNQNC